MPKKKKSVCAEAAYGLPVFKVCTGVTHPLPEGYVECLRFRQVFWLAIHPPGTFPVIQPVVCRPSSSLTAAGPRGNGSQKERHPSSLSSPYGRRDPIFCSVRNGYVFNNLSKATFSVKQFAHGRQNFLLRLAFMLDHPYRSKLRGRRE